MFDAFGKLAAFIDEIASKKFDCFSYFRLCDSIRQRIATMSRVFDKVATSKVIHLDKKLMLLASYSRAYDLLVSA